MSSFHNPIKLLLISLSCLYIGFACQSVPFPNTPKSRKGEIPQVIDTIFLSPSARPQETIVNPQTGYAYTVLGASTAVFQGTKLIDIFKHGNQTGAVDEMNNWVYILGGGKGTVNVMQNSQVITTIKLRVEDPYDIAVDPNTGLAYVVSPYVRKDGKREIEGIVTLIKGPEIVGELSFGRLALKYVEIDTREGYIYLGDLGGELIVLKDLQEIARYEYPGIDEMDIHEQTGNLYVDTLSHITQFQQGKPVRQVARKDLGERGSLLEGFKVHPITGDIYIMDRTNYKVVVVRDMVVIGRALVGSNPVKMAIDPITENVYVTDVNEHTVTAIQGTTVLTTYNVGWYPYGIGVNPANGMVYVSNTNAGSVTILGFPDE